MGGTLGVDFEAGAVPVLCWYLMRKFKEIIFQIHSWYMASLRCENLNMNTLNLF